MKQLFCAVALSALAIGVRPMAAQNTKEIEKQVTALNAEWTRAWAARDVEAYMAVLDTKSPGLFIMGGQALSADSLRATFKRITEQRTNEAWTNDRVIVTPLNDNSALLQVIMSGHYTLANGQTWEFQAGGGSTALVQKRGNAWKIVAFQNAISGGKQVKK